MQQQKPVILCRLYTLTRDLALSLFASLLRLEPPFQPCRSPPFPAPASGLVGSLRLQVLRYTALASGIVYGVVHRKTLQDRFDHHQAEKETQLRQHWLEEAKKAWAQKQIQSKDSRELGRRIDFTHTQVLRSLVPAPSTDDAALARRRTVVTDPEAPGFDLEALLKSYEK